MSEAKRLKMAQLEIMTLRAQNTQLKNSEKLLQDQLDAYRELVMNGDKFDNSPGKKSENEAGEAAKVETGKSASDEEIIAMKTQIREKELEVGQLEAKLVETKQELMNIEGRHNTEIDRLNEEISQLKRQQMTDQDKIADLESVVAKATKDGVMHRAMHEMVLSSQSKMEGMQRKIDTLRRELKGYRGSDDMSVASATGLESSTSELQSQSEINKALAKLEDLSLNESDIDDDASEATSTSKKSLHHVPAGSLKKGLLRRGSTYVTKQGNTAKYFTPRARSVSGRISEHERRMQIRSAEDMRGSMQRESTKFRVRLKSGRKNLYTDRSYDERPSSTDTSQSTSTPKSERRKSYAPQLDHDSSKLSSTWGSTPAGGVKVRQTMKSRAKANTLRGGSRSRSKSKSKTKTKSKRGRESKKRSKYREFMAQAKILSDRKKIKDSEWNDRQEALQKIRDLVQEGLLDLKSWPGHIEPVFRKILAIQLEDLRTAIVKEVCSLLAEAVDVLQHRGVELVRFFIPYLFPLLYVTIKIVSKCATGCINYMVKTIRSYDVLPELVAGCDDAHAPVRQRGVWSACFFCCPTIATPKRSKRMILRMMS